MYHFEDKFGVDPGMAATATPAIGTAPNGASSPSPTTDSIIPPANAARALVDPKGSAIFWLAAFAIFGLAMVSGQLKVSAAVNARGGKK